MCINDCVSVGVVFGYDTVVCVHVGVCVVGVVFDTMCCLLVDCVLCYSCVVVFWFMCCCQLCWHCVCHALCCV